MDDRDGYWEQFFDFVKESLLVKGFISGEDFSLFTITKDENEAIEVDRYLLSQLPFPPFY